MTRTAEYDTEAVDLVTRTLQAVAVDTPVAEHAQPPSDRLPPTPTPVVHLGSRRRRVRTVVAVTTAAAAVLAGILVWSGRGTPGAEGPPDVGTAPEGENPYAPPELVPDHLPDGLVAVDEASSAQPSVMYATQAMLLERDGARILSAVVTWPDGGPAVDAELDLVARALGRMTGADPTEAVVVAPPGETAGYLTMPLDADAPGEDVQAFHELLTSEGLSSVRDLALTTGWTVREVDLGWVPGVAPTTVRSYTGGDGRHLDLYAVAGDLPTAGVVTALLPGAHPYPVGGLMGWRMATGYDGETESAGPEEVTVWQPAPGTVAVIVADPVTDAGVPRVIESISRQRPASGDRPQVRVAAQSERGRGTPWVVEVAEFIPGEEERPCISLWVAGQVPHQSCGSTGPATGALVESFGAVTRLDGDRTVVFGLVAATVARVTTDAPGAEQPTVETQPVEAGRAWSLNYAVMIIHGDREAPQTFRLLDAEGHVLQETQIDLNVVGG